MTKAELIAYREGYLYALWTFAHWKDGITYVGSTGKTYNQARLEFDRIYEDKLSAVVEP